MTATGTLSGVKVLVTRPAAQAEHLCSLITAAGGEAVRFPVMAIEPVAAELPELARYDWLIFISANAVRHFCAQLHAPLSADLRVAVIGGKTAAALAEQGVTATLVPASPYTSEALLQQPPLQTMHEQRVLIVRGVGGREQLRDTLRQRGAQVDYCEVYRRVLPQTDTEGLLARWRQDGVDLVTLSSNEGLINLLQLLGDKGLELLKQTPLIAIGGRMAATARERGLLLAPVRADNASDEAVLAAVTRWATEQQGSMSE